MEFQSKEVERLTITVEEGARMCGCCINTFRNMMRSKGFPLIKVGRRLIIPKQPFVEWLERAAITNK